MLRFVIWLVLLLAFWMLLRLILLSFRKQSSTNSGKNIVINMPAKVVHPLQVRSYKFRNFDFRSGPPDPKRFCERLYLTLGSSDDPSLEKKYSFLVATPAGLNDTMRAENRDFQFGRNLLLVERYDMELILRAISRHLDELDALAEEVR